MIEIEVSGFCAADENVLTFDVPDEALERAALSDRRIVTFVYCTQDWYGCPPQ